MLTTKWNKIKTQASEIFNSGNKYPLKIPNITFWKKRHDEQSTKHFSIGDKKVFRSIATVIDLADE